MPTKRIFLFILISIVVVHIIVIFIVLKPQSNLYIGDEMDKYVIYQVSQSILRGDVEPSPYWNIGYPASLALLHRFGIPYITAEKWLSLPFSILMLGLAFIISYKLSDFRVAFFTSLVLIVSETYLLRSVGSKDFMMSSSILLLAILGFCDFNEDDRYDMVFLYGLILGIYFTFRYIGIYLLPGFIIYIFSVKGKVRGLFQSLVYTGGFTLGALPQFVIATYTWGNPFYSGNAKTIWFTINNINDWPRFFATNREFSIFSVIADNPIGFILNWFRGLNNFLWFKLINPPLIYLSYAGLIVFLLRKKNRWLNFSICILSLYLMITFTYKAKIDYLLPLIPFLSFGGVWFIFEFIPGRLQKRRFSWIPLRYVVLILIIAYMLIYSYNSINKTDESIIWEREATGRVADILRSDEVFEPSSVLSTDMWYLYLPGAKDDLWEYDQVPFNMTEPEEVLGYVLRDGYRYLLLYDRDKRAFGNWAGLPKKLMDMKLPDNFKLMLDMEDSRRRLMLYKILKK